MLYLLETFVKIKFNIRLIRYLNDLLLIKNGIFQNFTIMHVKNIFMQIFHVHSIFFPSKLKIII